MLTSLDFAVVPKGRTFCGFITLAGHVWMWTVVEKNVSPRGRDDCRGGKAVV